MLVTKGLRVVLCLSAALLCIRQEERGRRMWYRGVLLGEVLCFHFGEKVFLREFYLYFIVWNNVPSLSRESKDFSFFRFLYKDGKGKKVCKWVLSSLLTESDTNGRQKTLLCIPGFSLTWSQLLSFQFEFGAFRVGSRLMLLLEPSEHAGLMACIYMQMWLWILIWSANLIFHQGRLSSNLYQLPPSLTPTALLVWLHILTVPQPHCKHLQMGWVLTFFFILLAWGYLHSPSSGNPKPVNIHVLNATSQNSLSEGQLFSNLLEIFHLFAYFLEFRFLEFRSNVCNVPINITKHFSVSKKNEIINFAELLKWMT